VLKGLNVKLRDEQRETTCPQLSPDSFPAESVIRINAPILVPALRLSRHDSARMPPGRQVGVSSVCVPEAIRKISLRSSSATAAPPMPSPPPRYSSFVVQGDNGVDTGRSSCRYV